ncbi:MAG TPA: NADP-dependent malic enzyme [Thermotogota bacterium]|nr:NADP-dependent malic enzyme [Thermotogota bacterium]HRW92028.1 NADP-dependent malic enzyme [Thermotogota bacterium]
MNVQQQALQKHREWMGKLEIRSKASVSSAQDLAVAYTPGVAEPCKVIAQNPEEVYTYTGKGNLVAVVSDGSAVLGLGNIGARAAIPVMEGKAVLFKEFAGIDAFPICLDTQEPDEIVHSVQMLAPVFGGINLEDISAPRCFDIERRLKESLDIPVFHDDQHGTAIVVLAGIINAMKVVHKEPAAMKVVINGAGAAGTAIANLLLQYGFPTILVCDRPGILYRGAPWMNWAQQELAQKTNPSNVQGSLQDAMRGADLFIGVSAPGVVDGEMVRSMNRDPIVFAMANPVPEILPDIAREAGACIVGTGRSDFPNQVNNVLAFPGIFKGALQCRQQISDAMKRNAAIAIASMVPEAQLAPDCILPAAFAVGVADSVAKAVVQTALATPEDS